MTFADLKILMARRYYRRRTVVRAPRKKWASNMQIGSLATGTETAKVLVENSVQTATPTPIIVKVGNIKLQGDVYIQNASGSVILNPSFVVMVFYLPEGITLNGATANSVASQHPEWIMAWKMIDTTQMNASATMASPSFSVSSRLKRNLNSGDRVCLGYMTDITSGSGNIRVNYTAQYWTCAN